LAQVLCGLKIFLFFEKVYYLTMTSIELPGGTPPIDRATWSGPSIPDMTKALLDGNNEAAFAAYVAWMDVSGTQPEIISFPDTDIDNLVATGRLRLAALLIERGLVTEISGQPTLPS